MCIDVVWSQSGNRVMEGWGYFKPTNFVRRSLYLLPGLAVGLVEGFEIVLRRVDLDIEKEGGRGARGVMLVAIIILVLVPFLLVFSSLSYFDTIFQLATSLKPSFRIR